MTIISLAVLAMAPLAAAGTVYNVFGDSISCPVADPAADALRYPQMVAAAKGWALNNQAISGSLAIDQSQAVYQTNVNADDTSSILIGTNDERNYMNDLNKLNLYRGAVSAEAAWLAIPTFYKISGQSPAVAYTGRWVSSALYPTIGEWSTDNGASASFTVSGTVIYVAMTVIDGSAGKIDIAVDGSSYGTFDSQTIAPITEGYGMVYGPSLIRIPALAAGVHHVTITVQGATPDEAMGGAYFDWAAGIPAGFQSANVYLGTVINGNAYGYATYGGSSQNITRYNQAILGIVSDLQSDGLKVSLVESNAFVDSENNLVDGVHPSPAGQAQLRDAFLAAINAGSSERCEKTGSETAGGTCLLAPVR